MIEKIIRKSPLNNEDYLIGYVSMMAPTCDLSKGKVRKMLIVHSHHPFFQGDIHFFTYRKKDKKWILLTENSYVNLNGDPRLIRLYQDLPRNEEIEFETFIRLIFYAIYGY